MASGKLRSIKREMEGKILSEVSGVSEVTAATANELNATSTTRALVNIPLRSYENETGLHGIPDQRDVLRD